MQTKLNKSSSAKLQKLFPSVRTYVQTQCLCWEVAFYFPEGAFWFSEELFQFAVKLSHIFDIINFLNIIF